MKKTMALILSMALICCGFTACGDNSKNNSEAAKTTDAVNDNANRTNEEETSDNRNGIEKIVTGAENAVDDLVSEGERIVDDAGTVLDNSSNNSLNND